MSSGQVYDDTVAATLPAHWRNLGVLELAAGDIGSLPAGARTTWHLTTPFKEFWVIA